MGILYTADKEWVTMFSDKITKSGTWEPKKEYQVALMLQGNKASVYVDGKLLGEEETMLTVGTPLELVRFCFGACEMHSSSVTVKKVFLYNRPLNSTEMTAIKDRKSDGSMHGGMSRALLLMLPGMWGIAALY
ncbi:trans-sialidase [Trypanosoma cruzi]|nr:trans-sialidase [Trypanosoma cruzi]